MTTKLYVVIYVSLGSMCLVISHDLYEAMVQEDSNELWICAVCSKFAPAVVSVDHPKSNQLFCVCV